MEESVTGTRTLQDILTLIDEDGDLQEQRRRELRWAVRKAIKLIGNPQAHANAATLNPLLSNWSAAMAGLSKNSFNNFRSRFRKALERYGVIKHPGRHNRADLSGDWRALIERLPTKRMQYGLSRFIHFASANGTSPHEVTEEHFKDLFYELRDHALIERPHNVYRQTCRLWNQAVDTVTGWPERKVDEPERARETYTVPESDYPASLRDDLEAWLDFLRGDDLESEHKPLRPRTIEQRRFQVRQLVSALVRTGTPIEEIDSLSRLVEIDHVKQALSFFCERAKATQSPQTGALSMTLLSIARHWVGVEDAHEKRLKSIADKVRRPRVGLTETNKKRLRQLEDTTNLRALLEYPYWLEKRARSEPSKQKRHARRMELAIYVELLIVTALRAQNLVTLDLNRHLQKSGAGADGRMHIVIPAEEVKNDRAIEIELPRESRALLRRYVNDWRPLIAPAGSPFLFPACDGGPKSHKTMWFKLKRRGKADLGLDLTSHCFRHIAAMIYLREHPDGYENVRRFLNHSSVETTTRYYTGIESKNAFNLYQGEVLKLRSNT